MRNKIFFSIITLICVSMCSTAMAAAEDDIKYRRAVMKAIGGHMGAIVAVIKGAVPHKSHLRSHAVGMNAASKGIRDIFPAGSDQGDTKVTAAVWEKPDEFKQAVMEFEQAADGFLKAVDGGDQAAIGEGLKALGGSCKGCHDDFRQKKK